MASVLIIFFSWIFTVVKCQDFVGLLGNYDSTLYDIIRLLNILKNYYLK